jgi:hypothetical protein
VAVRPLVLWFAIQIVEGIALIHGKVGWFVVGPAATARSTAR